MAASVLPVLIDFWAPWCQPCRQLSPLIEQLAARYEHCLTFLTCNIDENPALSVRFSITSVPTVVVIADGQIVKQFSGARPRVRLLRELAEWLI